MKRMKKDTYLQYLIKYLGICLLMLLSFWLGAQDTFSITAVDPETGQVGTAGASCLDDGDIAGGVSIIADILPGKGAINTQSYWNPTNQANARIRMEAGDSPEVIMNWLENNDAQGNPAIRQYGAASFDEQGNPAAAAFTGVNCLDYKNHIVGEHYAIQGNILLGQEILDSMQSRFLAENGSLAEKLMAALQGANVPGADTRCASQFTSSESAYLMVANPMDHPDSLYLEIIIGSTPFGSEPIDALQESFDEWLLSNTFDPEIDGKHLKVYPNPANTELYVDWEGSTNDSEVSFKLFTRSGEVLKEHKLTSSKERLSLEEINTSGLYFYQLLIRGKHVKSGLLTIEK
jgi:uncharacterized Ntn-hydrolase superfamily protein